jgi:large subunit ribosomal protein L15
MQLHQLKSPVGSRIKKVRRGRGQASGAGKQSGRGDNGQRSRSGRGIIPGSEGGQMPIIRRLPKVGFTSANPIVYQVVQLDALNIFEKNTVINADLLKRAKLISNSRKPYKILNRGELNNSLNVQAFAFSVKASEKIIQAGGRIEVIGKKLPAPVKVKRAKK